MQTLIYHTGALGDFVTMLPFVKAWNRAHPYSKNILLGRRIFGELGIAAGLFSSVWDIDRAKYASLFSYAPNAEMKRILSLMDCFIVFASDDSPVIGNIRSLGAKNIICQQPFPLERISVVDYHLSLLNCPFDDTSFLNIAARNTSSCHNLSTAAALHPGSGSLKKNWPDERFKQLASLLKIKGMNILWLYGPAEESLEITGTDARTHTPDLWELAGLLAGCALYVGNDSGVSHLAAATGCPSVVLFGPSDHVIWRPRGPAVRTICSQTGKMEDIAVESVYAVCDELLSANRTGI